MENTESCCIARILKVIDVLQKESVCEELPEGCNRPFLGNSSSNVYNTRPITLYTRSGNLFTANYYVENSLRTSDVFRVESVNGCCATLRILSTTTRENNTCYSDTNEFITINLECFCGIRCLNDTFIEL